MKDQDITIAMAEFDGWSNIKPVRPFGQLTQWFGIKSGETHTFVPDYLTDQNKSKNNSELASKADRQMRDRKRQSNKRFKTSSNVGRKDKGLH